MGEGGVKKQCSKCGEWKELKEFNKNKTEKDGYSYLCKNCRRIYDGLWRKKNLKKVREQSKKRQRTYRLNNPKKIKELKRTYRLNNPEKVRKREKKWRKNNPEKKREHGRRSQKRLTLSLRDRYIKDRLKALGITQITPEIIQTKRGQIMVYRALKQLKEVIHG